MPEDKKIEGVAAGVTFIAFEPAHRSPTAPLVVVLHLMDPPRSEAAMAAALPLTGIDAWRVYLGLPMMGTRAPTGGFEEIVRLATEDGLMNLLSPVVVQAAGELPAAVAEIRNQLGAQSAPLALIGGSAGGAAVLLALTETELPVDAAVLLNPASRAATIVQAFEAISGQPYEWTEPRTAAAARIDFVARAGELRDRRAGLHLLFVVGAAEEIAGLLDATKACRAALAAGSAEEQVALVEVEGLGHALAEEPGIEAAPQTPGAAKVDTIVTAWLQQRFPA